MQSVSCGKKWRLQASSPELGNLRIRVSKAKKMRIVWEGRVSFFEELRVREERARLIEERWSEDKFA